MQILKKILSRLHEAPPNRTFIDHYFEWRAKRVAAILNHYNPSFFFGKSLLEVGCGYGDIGTVFSNLGAAVTCSDARAEHLSIIRERHSTGKFRCRLESVQRSLQHPAVVARVGLAAAARVRRSIGTGQQRPGHFIPRARPAQVATTSARGFALWPRRPRGSFAHDGGASQFEVGFVLRP